MRDHTGYSDENGSSHCDLKIVETEEKVLGTLIRSLRKS